MRDVQLSYLLLVTLGAVSNFILVPIHINLLLTTFFTIYIGCHNSLKSSNKIEERLSSEDAYWFPVVGSCTLFGLYMLFKVFNKEMVNYLLTGYFFFVGVYAVAASIAPLFNPEPNAATPPKYVIDFSLTLPFSKEKLEVKLTSGDIIAVILSSIFGIWYITTKHHIGNNIFGIAFSIQGISSLSLGSYKTGAILLTGLFFYDIFWVFGTDVMVTVAKSFDAPIKLLFVRTFATADTDATFSMLGLGDIVIPGIFIALLLRFDGSRALAVAAGGKKPASPNPKIGAAILYPQTFTKTYFNVTMIGYMLGLITTVLVMYAFKAAQPALLYLVPYCLGFSFLTAVARGEVSALLAYTEEDEKKETKKD